MNLLTYIEECQRNNQQIYFTYLTKHRGEKNKSCLNYELQSEGIWSDEDKFLYNYDRIVAFGDEINKKSRYDYVVYVLEIDGNPNYVYVGQTSNTREHRMQQHLDHYKSAPSLRHAETLTLRPDLYEGLPIVDTQAKSEAQEAMVAANLKARGFIVEGGH